MQNLIIPVGTSSTENNLVLKKQLITRNINLNQQIENKADPSFQGVNQFFVLFFENMAYRMVHTGYYKWLQWY